MDLVHWFVDFFLHLDKHLAEVIASYGGYTYALLFAIVFLETGLVVTPILPGDSLLFAAGTFAALGSLNVWVVVGLLCVAAVLGDTVNYAIGKYLGPKVFHFPKSRFFNPEHLGRRTRSTRGTAARRSSSRASCRLSGPLRRLSRASGR